MRRLWGVGLALALAAALGGCAAATGGGMSGDRDLLTRQQIAAAGQSSALDVVRSERPHWLTRRGGRTFSGDDDIVVYLDGARLGGPSSLGGISAFNVQTMRYYDEAEAQLKWGAGHLHGAIEVITRRD